MDVLDVPCGHGRIANRLAEQGCCVTGLDATRRFLDLARRDAAERGVKVTYVHGDLRALEWTGQFDRAVDWFTSFGYFTDEEDRRVLAEAHRALRPGGRDDAPAGGAPRAGELGDRAGRRLAGRPPHVRAADRKDPHDADRGPWRQKPHDAVSSGCSATPELRAWLLAAGFSRVDGYGADGEPLTADSRRMIAVAYRNIVAR